MNCYEAVGRAAALLALISCAAPAQQSSTIEPAPSGPQDGAQAGFIAAGDGNEQTHGSTAAEEPQPPQSAAATGAIASGNEGVSKPDPGAVEADGAADREFVQSREPKKPAAQDVQALPIHLAESWWPFRAQYLGITVAEAKRRDLAFSASQPPQEFWDEQTAVEAVSVWSVLCNECHGGRRAVEDALSMPVPAPSWGQGEGLFFGNRRAYRHAFDIVYSGGPKQNGVRSEMIAWKKELSREQIWSLLYFLEYQSGGIEGRFPPSLYPRRPESLGAP